MYFKAIKGTETFDKLSLVWDKMNECNAKAKALVEQLGFSKFGRSNSGIAGGISCIESDVKPEGYRTVGKKYLQFYFPKTNQKDVLDKIQALPVVSHNEYNETIGFKGQFTPSYYISHFGSRRNENEIVIHINDDAEYIKKPDMIEITFSEYKSLMEVKNP